MREKVTQPDCVEFNKVSFRYANEVVLQDVSFRIASGDYVGVIGPNGGGKTTLIKIILGILKPSSGTVRIFGKQLASSKERVSIGYVPQRPMQNNPYFPATVAEVVNSGRTARVGVLKRFSEEDIRAVNNAMELSGVAQYRSRLIGELSGGECQRAFIARALAGEPKVLILDEPTAGVDIRAQENFYHFLHDLNARQHLTIIFVSHDIDVIAHEAKTLICLNRRLICHGAPQEYFKEEYLKKLYGSNLKIILHGH